LSGRPSLNSQILLGAALGAATGFYLNHLGPGAPAHALLVNPLQLAGSLFVDLLKMVLIPLVLTSVASGVASLGEHEDADRIWRWTLIYYLSTTLLAALLGLPKELYQAATIDGASGWQQFRHLTLPLMRPTFYFAVVMATIWNIQLFDSVSILTDGGPVNASATVVWYIYKAMFQFNDKTGFAASLSFVLLLFILALTLIEIRLLRKRP